MLRRRRDSSMEFGMEILVRAWNSLSHLWRQLGQNSAGRADLIADDYPRTGTGRKIDIDARAKPDEAIPLTFVQGIARLGIAENALCDQSRHLHRSDNVTLGSAYDNGVALVFQRSLVERRIEKRAREISD